MQELKNTEKFSNRTQLEINELLDNLLNHCDILIKGSQNKGDWSEPFIKGVYAVKSKISYLKHHSITDSKKHNNSTNINDDLIGGLVKILKTPISERYCKVGDEAVLDVKNKKIRCGGAWFDFDERWTVEPCQ